MIKKQFYNNDKYFHNDFENEMEKGLKYCDKIIYNNIYLRGRILNKLYFIEIHICKYGFGIFAYNWYPAIVLMQKKICKNIDPALKNKDFQ